MNDDDDDDNDDDSDVWPRRQQVDNNDGEELKPYRQHLQRDVQCWLWYHFSAVWIPNFNKF